MASFSPSKLPSPRTINLNRETFGIWRWQMTNHLKYMRASFLTEPFSKMAVPEGETDDQRKIRQVDYEEKEAAAMSLLSTRLSDSPAASTLVTGTNKFHEAWNLLVGEYSLEELNALKQMYNLRMKKGESPIDVHLKLLQIISCVEDPSWSPHEEILIKAYLDAIDDPKYDGLKDIWTNLPHSHHTTMKSLVRMFKDFMVNELEENVRSAALKRRK